MDTRANQKARTRAAIVAAAQELAREGLTPTIAQAAERGRVSRATAHRYFPTQEALLVELAEITPAAEPVEALVENFASDEPEQRLLQLLDIFNPIVVTQDEHMRRALRVYLDTWLRSRRNDPDSAPPVREGRRMRWLEKALEPLQDLPEHQKRRLQSALALTLGPDSIVIMKDVCRLDNEETLEVLRWAAIALLRAAVDDAARLPDQTRNRKRKPRSPDHAHEAPTAAPAAVDPDHAPPNRGGTPAGRPA